MHKEESYYIIHYTSGLKPGQTIWVIQVMFCLGQVGLTQFMKYQAGLTQILHWITCINNAVLSLNLEVSVPDNNDGSVSSDSPQNIWKD